MNFQPRTLLTLTVVLMSCLAGAGHAQVPLQKSAPKTIIGQIELVEGDARIIEQHQPVRSRAVQVGTSLNEGDTLTTGKNSEIHLRLDDGSVYALRANTQMNLMRHRTAGGQQDGSTVKLLQGALRTITGWLGRRSPESVRLLTPTATIGIRGTDHEVVVIQPRDERAPAGTYDKVNAGATVLKNSRGETEIIPGQIAYAHPKAIPRILPDPPVIFHPTRNEKRLEGLDAAMAKRSGQQQNRNEASGSATNEVRLQGNTRLDATTRNTNATASGTGNKAKNQAGVIGGE